MPKRVVSLTCEIDDHDPNFPEICSAPENCWIADRNAVNVSLSINNQQSTIGSSIPASMPQPAEAAPPSSPDTNPPQFLQSPAIRSPPAPTLEQCAAYQILRAREALPAA